uniref:Hemolysin-type calcium-binding repeat-containing protein n=1 Tax=Candidatus Kentrum eta TaxID=2126337 RepID=A0A450U7U6_9GAMM|nr:MAG: Hemolysin-type calcium-binding repeat-containing protein [Candidatus Kentron sp. H]VFJ89545.1 MAG: Hemolysin-type calcium-binding repeat-containing protein [Candidatus Kentron sp. H]VFJ96235.1 MAG: Hemolysin-type calcium-binding repeat-containing protein [Candidatus Kentron sp. H]
MNRKNRISGNILRKMKIPGCLPEESSYSRAARLPAVGLLALFATGPAFAAGPGGNTERFPDYKPAHTVIKCPHIPEGLKEIPKCAGQTATCIGTEGIDLILGSDHSDVIVAGAGNDVVHGDAEGDIICGGPGNDSLMGARGADHLFGGPGNDWLFGAPDGDELNGGEGDFDVLWGGPGYDDLDGGPGTHDVCMLQREMGDFDAEGCNTVYPPPGYTHDAEPDPGVLRKAEPLKL